MTAAEKRAGKAASKLQKGSGIGRKRGVYLYVDSEPVRIARHAYAAAKRLADAEGRTLADTLTELIMDGLTRKLGLDPAAIPSRKL